MHFCTGASIFLIYTLISLPFHILNVNPEVLNNISTNVPLNITFFCGLCRVCYFFLRLF